MATKPVFNPNNNAARQAKRSASRESATHASRRARSTDERQRRGRCRKFRLHAAAQDWRATVGLRRSRPPASASSRRRRADDSSPHQRDDREQPQRVDRSARFAARDDLCDRLRDIARPRRQRPQLRMRIEAVVMQRDELRRQTEMVGEVVVLQRRKPATCRTNPTTSDSERSRSWRCVDGALPAFVDVTRGHRSASPRHTTIGTTSNSEIRRRDSEPETAAASRAAPVSARQVRRAWSARPRDRVRSPRRCRPRPRRARMAAATCERSGKDDQRDAENHAQRARSPIRHAHTARRDPSRATAQCQQARSFQARAARETIASNFR